LAFGRGEAETREGGVMGELVPWWRAALQQGQQWTACECAFLEEGRPVNLGNQAQPTYKIDIFE